MLAEQSHAETADCRTCDIWEIRRLLSSDRHGEIATVLVAPDMLAAAEAVAEYCWHDAVMRVEDNAVRCAA